MTHNHANNRSPEAHYPPEGDSSSSLSDSREVGTAKNNIPPQNLFVKKALLSENTLYQ